MNANIALPSTNVFSMGLKAAAEKAGIVNTAFEVESNRGPLVSLFSSDCCGSNNYDEQVTDNR